MKNQLLKKQKQIDDVLFSFDFITEPISLFYGIGGVILYYAYAYKCTEDEKYADNLEYLLELSINKIENNEFTDTFSNGLAGYCWLIQYISKIEAFEIDSDSFLTQFDEYLSSKANEHFENDYLDFMHGALGITFYFLTRWKNTKNKSLKSYYEEILLDNFLRIKNNSITNETGKTYWNSLIDTRNNLWGVNLGLSHGIPGVVRVLQMFIDFKFPKKRNELNDLINNANNLIVSTENEVTKQSRFPAWFVDGKKATNSRLAWCYGDLTTVLPLYYSTKQAEINKAIYTWEQTLKRKTPESAILDEPSICHGAFGLGHIYNKIYQLTGKSEFMEASFHWFGEGLKMGENKDGLAGFLVRGMEFKSWVGKYDLLNGIAGIGLTIQSVVSKKKAGWDACLLLSCPE